MVLQKGTSYIQTRRQRPGREDAEGVLRVRKVSQRIFGARRLKQQPFAPETEIHKKRFFGGVIKRLEKLSVPWNKRKSHDMHEQYLLCWKPHLQTTHVQNVINDEAIEIIRSMTTPLKYMNQFCVKCRQQCPLITIDQNSVPSKNYVRCLGLYFDKRLHWTYTRN